MTADRKLTGLVLAGGLSSRMGSDKAMLSYKSQTLLQHQAALLSPICARVVISGVYAGFECIPDAIERCGPLGGLYSVARQCPDSALLVVAVDMLQITQAQLMQLTQASTACHFSGQPLPAFFPDAAALLAAIQHIFAAPERSFSLRRLHTELSSTAIRDAGFAPKNINTLAAWQALES